MSVTLADIKARLLSRGANGIRGLGIVFRNMDNGRDRKLDKNDLLYGLRDYGLEVTAADVDAMVAAFDRDSDGRVNFDEFMVGLRGTLNVERQGFVDKAFKLFDADGNGSVELADIKAKYNAKFHPKVQKGEMTEDEALAEFLKNFDSRDPDGKVTLDEFRSYYADISASIDDDAYFALMISRAWRMPDP